MEIKNYGFIPDVIIEGVDYVAGEYTKLGAVEINPLKNWTLYLPDNEFQRKAVETMNCTSFGTLNCVEIILNFLGIKSNYSDRALGIAAGTTPQGNSVHKVAETIRTVLGCVNENLLPFDQSITTWGQYYSPNPLPESITSEGKKWKDIEWNFGHQWVFQGGSLKDKQVALKAALGRSPVGVSVQAWTFDNEKMMYTKPLGGLDNHWCVLINMKENEWWEVFDTYDGFIKRLIWGYDFGFAKEYTLLKRPPVVTPTFTEQEKNILLIWLDSIKQWLLSLQVKFGGLFGGKKIKPITQFDEELPPMA